MLTISEAFNKFKSKLEITQVEQENASRRHQTIRQQVGQGIDVVDDFLTGSYRRHTKTKPLKDVDIFVVLADSEKSYLDQHPTSVLAKFEAILLEHYPRDRVEIARRSVQVKFGKAKVDEVDQDVVSFDVVPAFEKGDHYQIPDSFTGTWIETNPKVHEERATKANKDRDGFWKPAVKMIKKWNDHHDKPIKPSFLLEVMALDLLTSPWIGPYSRELRQFFASAAEQLDNGWPDPAGLGPAVSDRMDGDPGLMWQGKVALQAAEKACTEAMKLERENKIGAALNTWQSLFGPLFVKS